MKVTKLAFKEWVKTKFKSPELVLSDLHKQLEEIQGKLEREQVSQALVQEEQDIFHRYQKSLRGDKENWRLKSCSLWLQAGYQNTKHFHRQTKARLWKNNVKEIKTMEGEVLSSFNKIKEVALRQFEDLYTETGTIDEEDKEQLLEHIPSIISSEENESLPLLVQSITKKEILGVIHQLDPHKAHGPDGFTTLFYKCCWHIIKFDFIRIM